MLQKSQQQQQHLAKNNIPPKQNINYYSTNLAPKACFFFKDRGESQSPPGGEPVKLSRSHQNLPPAKPSRRSSAQREPEASSWVRSWERVVGFLKNPPQSLTVRPWSLNHSSGWTTFSIWLMHQLEEPKVSKGPEVWQFAPEKFAGPIRKSSFLNHPFFRGELLNFRGVMQICKIQTWNGTLT